MTGRTRPFTLPDDGIIDAIAIEIAVTGTRPVALTRTERRLAAEQGAGAWRSGTRAAPGEDALADVPVATPRPPVRRLPRIHRLHPGPDRRADAG